MFNKIEMLGAITISIIGGIAIGYSKAREMGLEALIKALDSDEVDNIKNND